MLQRGCFAARNERTVINSVRSVIKRLRFPLDIMLLCVRWYVAYALSLRNLEEIMQERGLFIDHSTIHRCVIKLVPVLKEAFRKRKRKRGLGAVGKSWRLDETYIKIGGEDRYWYRAVDKQGNTVDFLLTAKRDRRAARRFFTRAVKNNRLPEIVNIDKSGANKAGIKESRLGPAFLPAPRTDPNVRLSRIRLLP